MIVFDFIHWLGMLVVLCCVLSWTRSPPLMNVRCRYSKAAWVSGVIWEVVEHPIFIFLYYLATCVNPTHLRTSSTDDDDYNDEYNYDYNYEYKLRIQLLLFATQRLLAANECQLLLVKDFTYCNNTTHLSSVEYSFLVGQNDWCSTSYRTRLRARKFCFCFVLWRRIKGCHPR